jgi:hypothetical protein
MYPPLSPKALSLLDANSFSDSLSQHIAGRIGHCAPLLESPTPLRVILIWPVSKPQPRTRPIGGGGWLGVGPLDW